MRKILIANRGEIAVRVIRACRDLQIASVAVYSDCDRAARHVRMADEAVAIGGNPPTDSYLRIDKITSAAKASGADAVHPGYGFLAENEHFAAACEKAKIVFVGPSAKAIELMGDKVTSRRTASGAGVSGVPGTLDPVTTVDEVVAFAAEHGYPVAIKAAFGGGGRGLKVARSREEIPELYDSAVREARASFGRGECFVERYLDRPRHVETQCLADSHGAVVVVSTRDCSLQRRHQKLVEEAPAPFLTEEQQALLYSSSKAILREAGYVGAGTCEFLIGTDGTVSFLQVNTRLQVEHPVTEAITGIDLVREQIRIAAGLPLSFKQSEVVFEGHAIECRVNAEDPARNFQPSPGLITAFHPPGGPGVRVDTHIYDGYQVPPYYDSLLAKVIVHGPTRAEAIARMRQALDSFIIEGVATTIPFLGRVMRHPDFDAGRVDTKFLERAPQLLKDS